MRESLVVPKSIFFFFRLVHHGHACAWNNIASFSNHKLPLPCSCVWFFHRAAAFSTFAPFTVPRYIPRVPTWYAHSLRMVYIICSLCECACVCVCVWPDSIDIFKFCFIVDGRFFHIFLNSFTFNSFVCIYLLLAFCFNKLSFLFDFLSHFASVSTSDNTFVKLIYSMPVSSVSFYIRFPA